MKKSFFSVAVAALILTGCGSSNGTESTSNEGTNSEPIVAIQAPSGYENPVINNKGNKVESKLGKLSIKLYSAVNDEGNAQSTHKGVVVNVNGKDSSTMPIQASYIDDEIVVAVYDEKNKLVVVSDAVEVTNDVPVVLVNLSI